MSQIPSKDPVDFSRRVTGSFSHPKFELVSESFETTWGFKSTSGKLFKISNRDLEKALSDIIAHWSEWTQKKLHINSEDPDDTLRDFSKARFSAGAHKGLAEVQRRGFLHLINGIAFASRQEGPYGRQQWNKPLQKEDYEAALDVVRDYSEQAQKLSTGAKPPPTPRMDATRIEGGENVLFYGAPGTGKSHDVWEMVDKKKDGHVVTVFHPDMQNSDFAGTLKPGVGDDGKVTYAFRPGPFARAVADAWANPGKKVYLVIEELNRAVAAAVFGELFQLLDRKPDGSSRYTVAFPSPEFEKWFSEKAGVTSKELGLPSNLWILATMNSADQGVYPLDTAFRRRWRQNYLPIDYRKAPDTPVDYVAADGKGQTSWRRFVQVLNEHLVDELDIDEDRLVGPRFVDEHDIKKGRLPGKLLIYLWDDLLRHHRDNPLFVPEIRTYGDLDRRMTEDKPVFTESFLTRLTIAPEARVDEEPIYLETF